MSNRFCDFIFFKKRELCLHFSVYQLRPLSKQIKKMRQNTISGMASKIEIMNDIETHEDKKDMQLEVQGYAESMTLESDPMKGISKSLKNVSNGNLECDICKKQFKKITTSSTTHGYSYR